jgi:hypothetical protein
VLAKAAPIDRTLILKDKIWTARLRIDHVVIFQASAPRIFNAAALIAAAAVVDLAVIASVVEASGAAVIDLAAADLAGSAAVADSGADAEN